MPCGFQSLGRDSGGWDEAIDALRNFFSTVSIPRSGFRWLGRTRPPLSASVFRVSIPRSGFRWLGLLQQPYPGHVVAWFQSLGRDSGGWDLLSHDSSYQWGKPFQSLGRDSGGWDGEPICCQWNPSCCFNPSVGIQVVGTRTITLPCWSGMTVSIPRSGFRWLGPGIRSPQWQPMPGFQSLGRDSGGWDITAPANVCPPGNGFNPSVGIQVVGTCSPGAIAGHQLPVSIPRSGFRWLGPTEPAPGPLPTAVSIPRSGFRWLGHFHAEGESGLWHVSIPRSGFRWLGPNGASGTG